MVCSDPAPPLSTRSSKGIGLTSVSLRQFSSIDHGQQRFLHRMVAGSDDRHFRQGVGRNERFEDPKNPVEECRDVNEELPVLQLTGYVLVMYFLLA
jgi:hypothetical protein